MSAKEPKRFRELPQNEVANLIEIIGAGCKISATKAIYETHGFSLKESKDIVDYLIDSIDWKAFHQGNVK